MIGRVWLKARKVLSIAGARGPGRRSRSWLNRFGQFRKRKPRIDIIGAYQFIDTTAIGAPLGADEDPGNTINWFIPPVGKGSGGHLNIFRLINLLHAEGFVSRVVIVGASASATDAETKSTIEGMFFPIEASIHQDPVTAPPARFSMATSWPTAYAVRRFLSTAHRCYFVQDFEPLFYPAGTDYALAEATYWFGFFGITAGRWLATKLASEYGMKTVSMGFSSEPEFYRPMPRSAPGGRRIFFYARPSTPRRGFELGLLVLHEVSRRIPGVEVLFAGGDTSRYKIPFDHVDAGVLELRDLAAVYSQCDVALVLSFSNASLLPLELMACGTPVVSNLGANNEWLLDHGNVVLAAPTIDGLASAICEILLDDDRRERLRADGLKAVATGDWGKEAAIVAGALRRLAGNADPASRESAGN